MLRKRTPALSPYTLNTTNNILSCTHWMITFHKHVVTMVTCNGNRIVASTIEFL